MHPNSHRHCQWHCQPDAQYRLGVEVEDRGDHQSEDRQHDGQREEQHQQEQHPGTRSDHPPGNFANRLSAVSQAHHQGSEIVNGSDKDRAEDHPQQSRQPAPEDGNCRSHDRASPSNTRKVVSKDHFLASRHKVDVVLKLPAWHIRLGVETEDLLSQPTTIGMIGDDKAEEGAQGNEQCGHNWTPIEEC